MTCAIAAAFEYMLDQLDASPEDFLHVASHTRYDHQSMHDMGFRNLILLDRGYDPVTHGYDYVTVKSLDDLNTMQHLTQAQTFHLVGRHGTHDARLREVPPPCGCAVP
ncbi:hypothetical protein SVIOM74S_02677 [Streptomyces violarus]